MIAGRPGTGKTVLGTGMSDNVSIKNGGSSLIFSLEMSHTELAKRTLASAATVRQDLIDSGKALEDEEACLRMSAAVNKVADVDVRLCDKPALSFSRLCSIARFEHRVRPLSLIVIDYLGLIQPDQNSKHQNRNQEVGAISRGLKALAKELEIPIIALVQLNRAIETRGDARPKMSDLRDSGEIEQDADVIIMAHRDNNTPHGEQGLTEFDVVKCRHAKPGMCLLQFQGDYARFVSVANVTKDEYYSSKEKPKARKSSASFLQ
ncbi:Replicative DNA helicase [compost metagenome]